MGTCKAFKRDGTRCTGSATYSDGRCWAHSEHTEDARKRGRLKGGRNRGGNAELAEVRKELKALVDNVLDGSVERGVGAVAGQIYNVILRGFEIERRVRETEETDAILAELRARVEEANREKFGA